MILVLRSNKIMKEQTLSNKIELHSSTNGGKVSNFVATRNGSGQQKGQKGGLQDFLALVAKKSQDFRTDSIKKETLEYHHIRIINEKEEGELDQLKKSSLIHGNNYIELYQSRQYDGLQCQYTVIIGVFILSIKILNLHRNSEDQAHQGEYAQILGEGSYGVVKKVKVGENSIAIKRLIFPKQQKPFVNLPYLIDPDDHTNPQKIRTAIKEYCMYKICSMLKIGPKIIFQDVYDLVCYNDCIEFQMQLCIPTPNCEQIGVPATKQQFQNDITDCLSTLHSVKFIHKDVKLDNTLYSPSKKGFVLTDFGFTHSVKEDLYEKTQTKFQGTKTHASPQMIAIEFFEKGFVNLYENDFHCMKVTFSEFSQREYRTQSYEDNSMSMGGSYYDEGSQSFNYNSMERSEESIIEQQIPVTDRTISNPPTNSIIMNTSGTAYSDYSTRNSCNEQFIKNGGQINFYEMKALYNILNSQKKVEQEQIVQIVQKTCHNQINPSTEALVVKMILLLLFPEKAYERHILNFQNTARVYGLNSEEALLKLKKIYQTKSIPHLDFRRVESAIQIFSKYNKYMFLKPLPNFISDMRIQAFHNNRHSLICSMKKQLREYLVRKQYNNTFRDYILLLGVEVCSYDDMTKQDTYEVVKNLKKVLMYSKQKNHEKIQILEENELMDLIFEVLEPNQEVQCKKFFNFMKYFLKTNKYEKAMELKNELDKEINKLEKYFTEDPEKQHQIKLKILNYELPRTSYLIKYHQYEEASSICINRLNHLQTWSQPNQTLFRKILLDRLITALIKLNRHPQAQLLNQKYLQAMRTFYFPRTRGTDFYRYHYYKGVLAFNRRQFHQAIEYFQSSNQSFEESIKSNVFTQQMGQNFLNIGHCYNKLNQIESALNSYQKAYFYSRLHNVHSPHNMIQILHFIIICCFRLKKLDSELALYFEEAGKLKNKVLQMELLGKDIKKCWGEVDFFPLQDALEGVQGLTGDDLLLIKKCIVKAIQPYLPKFYSSYVNTCQQIVCEYVNNRNMISKGLPYAWRMLKVFPRSSLNQLQVKQMNFYVDLLIKSNSSRRALNFLKTYAYSIPEEFQNLKKQAFLQLKQISTQLATSERNFYKFVWREKSFRSHQYLEMSINKLNSEVVIDVAFRKLWEKKMKKIQLGTKQVQILQRKPCTHYCDTNLIEQKQVNSIKDLVSFRKGNSKYKYANQ